MEKSRFFTKKGQKTRRPGWGALCFLAAAISLAATVVVVVAAAAEQNQQNDDPAQIAAAEAVITKVTHSSYLRKI